MSVSPRRASLAERRLRIGLLAASLAVAVLSVAVLLVRGGGGDDPPATRAASLVPPNALVYVHLSTDGDREPVRRALALARRFPGWPRLRDDVLGRLGAEPGPRGQRELGEFAGDEGALALLDTKGEQAAPLILLAVTDRDRARTYLDRRAGPAVGVTPYKGTQIRNYGSTQAAFAGDFLALGGFNAVSAAVDRAAGRGRSLADLPAYRKASAGLPDDRVVDAWASAAGVRRLLAPAGGPLGTLGTVLDRPGLVATAAALAPTADGARVTVRSLLARGAPPPASFEPDLLDSVPATAVALVETTRVDRAVGRLLDLQPGAGAATALARLAGDRRPDAGIADLDRRLAPLVRGEAALSVVPARPAPVVTLVARVGDERAARAALARAGPRPALAYAIADGRLIVSTSVRGIRAARDANGALRRSGAFQRVLGGRSDRVTSLVFLDPSKLLGLIERAGLADGLGLTQVRDDLRKIRAAGAASSAKGDIATTELYLEIP